DGGRTYPHPGGAHAFDLAMTSLASAILYGLAAAGLTFSQVADFDRIIDRSRSAGRDTRLVDAGNAQAATPEEPHGRAPTAERDGRRAVVLGGAQGVDAGHVLREPRGNLGEFGLGGERFESGPGSFLVDTSDQVGRRALRFEHGPGGPEVDAPVGLAVVVVGH